MSQLTVNAAKSKVMTIEPNTKGNPKSKYPASSPLSLKMGNTELEEVETNEYLGVHIDNKLNFKTDMNMLNNIP